MKKLLSVFLIAVMVLGFIAGCAPTETVQLDEKTLNVYTALEDDQINAYLTTFKAAHPDVTINITRASTGIITAKLLAEKDNPQADVVWGVAATSLLVLKSNNMLEAYAPKGLERILPEFKDAQAVPFWVGIDAWETAFLVNKDVLAKKGITKIPTGYQDLLDPAYKGLIVMPDPNASGTGLLTLNGLIKLYGETGAWDYLKALDANIAAYLQSGSAPAKNTATGEYGIGISFGYRCIKSQKDLGDKGVVVFPVEGSGWDVEANALMKRKEGNKNIAKEFLDWAITDEAMQEYKKSYPIIATGVGKDLPAGYTKDPISQLIKGIDLQWCAEHRDATLKQWTDLFSGKVKK